MGGDRVASFTIGVGGDDADIRSILSGLKSQFKSAVADLEATAGKVKLFEGLQDKTKAAADALADATKKAAALADELDKIQKSGGKGTDELTKSLKAANAEVAIATRQFNATVDSVTKLQTQLSRAGVDTKNLAAEQTRLAAASRAAADAAANQAAQQLLGLKTLKDVTPEIQRLHAAYNTLSVSGTLSVKELAVAQQQLKDRVVELRGQVTGTADAAKSGGVDLAGFFQNSLAPALGLTISIGTLVAGLQSAIAAGKAMKQATAEVGAVSNLTGDQLRTLELGARDLAGRIGTDVVESLRALKEIVRSTGAGPDDALRILSASAETAKASVTDLGVVAKVGADLISAYGVKVAELPRVFDGLFASMKAGGPTFNDLAGGIGNLSVVAKSVGVSLSDLSALLNVMASASGDSAGSITALQRILVAFNTEETRQKLRDLRIEATTFTGVMQELAAKGIPITQLIDLGLAGTKTAVGVAALTRSADDLTAALDRQRDALGTTQAALIKYLESPKGRADQFNAAIEDSKLLISELAGEGSKLGTIATITVVSFNELLRVFSDTKNSAILARDGFAGVADALKLQAEAAAAARTALEELDRKIGEKQGALAGISAELLADAKAIQEATAKAIVDVITLADAQIAALDRSAKAAADTAQKTLEIQTQAAADKLALITKSEKEISDLTEKAVAERTAALKRQGRDETEIIGETAKIRLASIAPTLAQYKDLYDKLTAQAQGYKAAVERIEGERVAFTQNIEAAIANIRGASIDNTYATYLDRSQKINGLITQARDATLRGETELGKRLSDQAIAEIGRLGPAYSANGQIIVTGLQAQEDKIGKLKRLQDEFGGALKTQGEKAKTGADETIAQIDKVLPHLNGLTDLYKELQKQVEAGLKIKVTRDEASFAALQASINELTKDRTVTVTIRTIKEGATPSGDVTDGIGGAGTFARGGPVTPGSLLRAVQSFAAGGMAFRRPSWLKVPGGGDGDTVPAALSEGSFVVRKSASQKYGDGIMGRLAQAFALGGGVGPSGGGVHSIGSIGAIASRMLGGDNLSGMALGFGDQDLHKVKVAAEQLFASLISEMGLLPHSTFGMDYSEYLGQVLELIERTTSAMDAHALFDPIDKAADSIRVATAQARLFHVPLTFGTNAVFGEDFMLTREEIAALQKKLGRKLKPRAMGGPIGDTVPALLTPGEYVMNPRAVANVSRLFGGGFLHALNSMRIPKGFFDGMLNIAPPPRPLAFAAGGPVPGAQAFAAGGSVRRGGGGVTVNIYAQRVDEAEVKRSIIPAIDKLMRRSK